MLKIAVLGSTRGTDLQALLDAQAEGTLGGSPSQAEISVVVSNRTSAYILERAGMAGVPTVAIPSKGKSRHEFEEELLPILKNHNIELIILIGFMRILSPEFVAKYPNRILNVHPSLLPKYAGGMNNDVHEQVLANNETVSGCTVHYVTAEVDEGEILVQEAVPVLPTDTTETLKDRVQHAEQVALLNSVEIMVNKVT